MLLPLICFIVLLIFIRLIWANPFYIPGLYLLLSNFFVIDLPFIPINTSKVFAIFAIISLIKRAKKDLPHLNYLQVRIAIVLTTLMAVLAPSIYHYLTWKDWPYPFLNTNIKGLWGLLFLFIKTSPKNIRDLFNAAIFCCVTSILLVAPGSIFHYLSQGKFIGRHFMTLWSEYPIKSQRNVLYWFIMDDNTCENVAVTSSVFIAWALQGLYQRGRKVLPAVGLSLAFLIFIFLINGYFINIVLFLFTCFLFFLLYPAFSKGKKNVVISLYCTLTMVISTFLLTQTHFYKANFSNKLVLDKMEALKVESLMEMNRISLFATIIKNWVGQGLIKGEGFVKSYDLSYTSGSMVTGHSTILDNFISFGIVFGLMANMIYFLPAMLLCFYLTRPGRDLIVLNFLLFLASALIVASGSIFGRESLQVGAYLSISSILINYLLGQFLGRSPHS